MNAHPTQQAAIDEVAAAAHRDMTQALHGAAPTQRHWLVDPLVSDAFNALPRTPGIEIVPIPIVHADMDAAARPYLVPETERDSLAKWTSVWLRESAVECLAPADEGTPRARSLCAFLDTPLPTHSLAAWMAARATVRDAAGRMRLFRFWDPRVMQHLVRASGGAEDWLPGFHGHWAFLDSFGRYRSWHRDGTAAAAAEQRRVLTAAEERWLDDISAVNALFEMNECRTLTPSDRLWTALGEANEAATNLGLADMRSRLCVASMRWRADLPLETSRRLLDIVAAARDAGVAVDAVLADIDDTDLELIRAQALATSRRDAAKLDILSEPHP